MIVRVFSTLVLVSLTLGVVACSSSSDVGLGTSPSASVAPGGLVGDTLAPLPDPALPVAPTLPSDLPEVLPASTTTTEAPTTTTTTTQPTTTTTVLEKISIQSDVFFDTGQATLKAEAEAQLADVVTQISAAGPRAVVRVVGHTDSRGSEAENLDLSERRAQAVADWLSVNGLSDFEIIAEGRGEAELLKKDMTNGVFDDSAGQQNRRVDIFFSS